jgi:hypothetical protein
MPAKGSRRVFWLRSYEGKISYDSIALRQAMVDRSQKPESGVIILVIALLGGFSGLGGGPFYGTGYYGGGGLGLVLIIVLILVLLGKL